MIHYEHTGKGARFILDGIVPDSSAFKNVGIAFALTLVFALTELIGVIFSHSTAVISTAIHVIGDSMMLALAHDFPHAQLGIDSGCSSNTDVF